jgi:hypothetical protein
VVAEEQVYLAKVHLVLVDIHHTIMILVMAAVPVREVVPEAMEFMELYIVPITIAIQRDVEEGLVAGQGVELDLVLVVQDHIEVLEHTAV